ncbi:hypothetical protein [Pseudoalteromonas sp. ZZD1]
MIRKNSIKQSKTILAIGLTLAINGVIPKVHAEETSLMPLTYVADKAISNNPEVQQA